MNENTIFSTVPAANDLHKVPGFDPMKYLRRTVNSKGEPVMRLVPHYQRLWFRLACPKGRMLLNPLRITDQLAIFEAKVFFHRDDAAPASSFTATKTAQETAGYIRAAQDEALMVALDNAGFGIQLCDVTQAPDGSNNGSPAPLVQMNSGKQGAPVPASVQTEPVRKAPAAHTQEERQPAPEPAPVLPVQTAEPVPEPVPAKQTAPASDPAPVSQDIPGPAPAPAAQPAASDQTLGDLAAGSGSDPAPAPQNEPAAPPAPVERQEPLETDQREEPAASDGQQSAVLTMLNFSAQGKETAAPAEEIPKQAETPPQAAPSYTDDMSVEEICQVMTLEEAGAIVVPSGPNAGLTMAQVAERRPSSLRFFMTQFYKCSNSQKAAATLLIQDMEMKKAG